MEANPDLHAGISEPRNRILHGQSSKTAADRMVFMRARRCAEQRHHAVALDLVDDAVVAVDRLLHQVEHRLQPPHAEFGIAEAVDQIGRVADIGKQQSEVLALAALGAERTKQPLRRRIGTDAARGDRGAAAAAEAAGGPVHMLTGVTFEA